MVLDALEQYLAQPHSKPQLIVVGTYGPHFPYVAPPELFLKYLKTAQLPATWQGNEPWLNAQQRNLQEPNTRAEIVLACQAAYKGLVEHTDGLIGRARAAFDVFTQNRGTPALFGYFPTTAIPWANTEFMAKSPFLKSPSASPWCLRAAAWRLVSG